MIYELDGEKVKIEIVRKNNKNIYFRFKEDGFLYITCNRFVSDKEIKRLLDTNKKSLENMYKKFKKSNSKVGFYYLGKQYTIVYDESLKKLYVDGDFIYSKDEKSLNKWLSNECVRIFQLEIDKCLARFTGIPVFGLRIRKMKTRWGVNNVTKKIITLNSELIKKDIDLIDYVIIHEICHFYEANHSSKFWYQVGLRYPNYKGARKRLRGE